MSDTRLSVIAELKIQGFQRNLTKMQKSLDRFQSHSLTKAATGLAKISAAFTAMGVVAVKASADIETLETSLVSLVGGTENAAKAMKSLADFTAKTPFQLEAVAGAFRQLVASGSSVDEATKQLQFLGDVAATTGKPINEIAAIFAKVNAKGKVELENLNQLAERGIPIFTALSEATGLLPSELGAGAVSVQQFNEVIASFAEAGGFAEGAMERLSQTTAGKFSTAMDNVKLATAEVGKALKPFVDGLLDAVTAVGQFIQQNPKLARTIGIVVGLTAALTALGAVAAAIAAAMITGLIPAMAAVAAPVLAVGVALLALVDATQAAIRGKQRLAAATRNAATAEREYNDEIKEGEKRIEEKQESISTLVEEYKSLDKSSAQAATTIAKISDLGVVPKDLDGDGVISFEELTKAVDKYFAALNQDVEVTALQNKKTGLEEIRDRDLEAATDLARNMAQAISRYGLKLKDFQDESGNIDRPALVAAIDEVLESLDGLDRATAVQLRAVRDTWLGTYEGLVTSANEAQAGITQANNQISESTKRIFGDDDAAEIRENLSSIQRQYRSSLASIDRLVQDSVITAEEAESRKTAAREDFLSGMETEYSRVFAEIDRLQADTSRTAYEEGKLDYLVNTYLPAILREFKGTYAEVKSAIEEALAEEAAQRRLEGIKEEVKQMEKNRRLAQQRLDAEKEINKFIGERPDQEVSQAEVNAAYQDAIKAQEELLDLEYRIRDTETGVAEDIELARLHTQAFEDRNKALQEYRRLRFELADQTFDDLVEGFADGTKSASEFTEGLKVLSDESARLTRARQELSRYLPGGDLDNTAGDLASDEFVQAQVDELDALLGANVDNAAQAINAFYTRLAQKVDVSDLDFKLKNNLISPEEYTAQLADRIYSDFLDNSALLDELKKDPLFADILSDFEYSWDSLMETFAGDERMVKALEKIKGAANGTTEKMLEFEAGVAQMVSGVVNFISTSMQQLMDGTKSFEDIMKVTIQRLVTQLISLLAQFAIITAITGGTGAIAQGGLKSFLSTGFQIPKFAEGGAVFGPTLALIGEKPGSRGEAVVPFEKIGQFVDMVGGGRSQEVVVTGVIKGSDIHISNQRGGRDRSRGN